MAKSSKLKIMISSRNLAPPFSTTPKVTFSDIRRQLKKALTDSTLLGRKPFEVWINEDGSSGLGTADSWVKCLGQAKDCDLLLVLYDGHAGWTKAAGEIGICHAEMMTGLSTTPAKVLQINLPLVATPADAGEAARNQRFQDYVATQNLFRTTASTIAELTQHASEAIADAMIELTQAGVREGSRGKFYSGAALDWSRLNFADRKQAMEGTLRQFLQERPKAAAVGSEFALPIEGAMVCFQVSAIPAALSVPAAKEMVGQPFLRDYATFGDLKRAKASGPVHLIACQKGVTEAQALRLLGFVDATVVLTPFGVYVADDIQKIQMVLLSNCRDDATTRHVAQRFFEWLNQSEEAGRLAARAKSRTAIVRAISEEYR